MLQEIVISGFGGQGVLSMGKILAYSGIKEDKEVSWFPAYGPEQRGGTANVTVIYFPMSPSALPCSINTILPSSLTNPRWTSSKSGVKPGGILIYDDYGIRRKVQREDINVYRVNAMDESTKMDNTRVFNMIVLAGCLRSCPWSHWRT